MDKAVIFDMDGVIIDSNPYHKIALKEFCARYGYQLTEEELRNKIYGRTNKEWIPALFNRVLTQEESRKYGEEKEQIFRDLYANDIRPVKGLVAFLEKLKAAAIPMAIGTSAPRSNVDFVLQKTGIGDFFGVILDESDVSVGKPNPEIYVKTAARLKFSPHDCIVIEDSLSGVASGQASGARVVGITTTHTAQELAHTDFIIADFVDLDPIWLIKKLFAL